VSKISKEFERLKSLSSWIGSDPTMIQGPGGNTSIKEEDLIWVKASGTKLFDAETKEIFVSLDRVSGLPTPASQIRSGSIETKLHLLIQAPVVVHTHSTSSLALGFREDLEDLVNGFGRTVVIPYYRPGELLAEAVSDLVNTSMHDFALLLNHGLIVWGNTVEEVQQRILRFENEFKKIVTYSESALSEAKKLLLDGNLDKYLTPDHAVFLDSRTLESIEELDFEPKWLREMYDQLSKVLASSLPSSNLSWLAKEEVVALQNWDAEKLRKATNSE
jgi:rhamnose utilization protein RhaD (predicted bifunctional aldolase and dehydrogenase)